MNLDQYKEELEILDHIHQVYSLLHIVANRIQTEADSGLKDITSRQLMLLIAIKHLRQEDATIVNIAATLGTSKQNVTRLVNAMIHAGYLFSRQGENDKRSVNIGITDLGLSVMQMNTVQSNSYFLDLFKNYKKEELITLRKLLEKLDKSNCRPSSFSEKAEIDIGMAYSDAKQFLNQLRETFL